MRLICGFYHFDGRSAASERLEKMIESMIEPGLQPMVARFLDGPVALAVVDFARKTPFKIIRGESGVYLAADVRLDEPEKLRRELQLPRDADDDEILSFALQSWGGDGLARILGDFAFACWDPKNKTLLCARDGMGIRPFFMSKDTRKDFAFASVPRALHAGGFASRDLDESFIASDLLMAFSGPGRSLFKDIARLTPGRLLHVSSEKTHTECYWRLDLKLAGKMKCSPEQAAEELCTILTEAVRCRLPKNGAVAAHLSGGLDSSAITVLAARLLRRQNRQLLAYSFLSSVAGMEDERPYVEAVLEQENDLLWTSITIDDPESFFWAKMDSDQLFPMDTTNPDIRVCADAASKGASMLLSGWGGDEGATFNGRGALSEALLRGRWLYLAHEIRALRSTRGWSTSNIVKGELLRYLLPRTVWNKLKNLMKKDPGLVNAISSLLRSEFADKAARAIFLERPNAAMNRYHLLTDFHLERRAEEWALMGSRYGLAAGFPMLDRRVVEFALSLPSQFFLRDGWKRRVYRDAMKGVLPETIRLRHHKFMSFPEVDVFLESQREKLQLRLMESCAHPRFELLFDRENIEMEIQSARDVGTVIALKRIFNAVAFLLQHSPR